ncbi:MAG TPA: hypothetical protein VFZ11_07740 [Gemmatimonadaceae bacterium]
MAEVHIERKERRAWPWVLLVLVLLALLAWWLLSQRRADDDVVTETRPGAVVGTPAFSDAATTASTAGTVDAFLQWVEDRQADPGMTLEHRHTAEGIRRLAAALGSVAERDTVGGAALRPQLDSLRGLADALMRDEQSTHHARFTHDAFTRAAAIMNDLQRRHPGAADAVSESRRAAQAVRAETPLLEQREDVRRFFERAADAVRGLAVA